MIDLCYIYGSAIPALGHPWDARVHGIWYRWFSCRLEFELFRLRCLGPLEDA